jgi:ADP-ribosylglycohydrolase
MTHWRTPPRIRPLDRFRGSLLGLAVGDALGTTVEFQKRGQFKTLVDMIGGGPFALAPGEWTDDTSMALCLATSLLERRGFDAHDQMSRYWAWYEQGYWSSTGVCFDIGSTTLAALERWRELGDPFAGATDPRSAGNGCIMRLAPVALYFAPDLERVEHFAAESARTTHGARECLDACRLLGRMIARAVAGQSKREVLHGDASLGLSPRIASLARGDYHEKDEDDIRGSGYVVESLEAGLWSFAHTESFQDAVLTAANLGDDADTTAAVCGQLAGAYYGEPEIPAHWLERLALGSAIGDIAERLGAPKRAPRP